MTDRSESNLTEIVETVAHAEYERQVGEALKHPGPRGAEKAFPAWEDMPLNKKATFKQSLLPVVMSVLNLVDAEPHRAKRGDEVEAWLKRLRDDEPLPGVGDWDTLDNLLDDYRLHADTGTPLDQDVEVR